MRDRKLGVMHFKLNLYEYTLYDGSKGHIAARSVTEVYERLKGRGVVSVALLPEDDGKTPYDREGYCIYCGR